MARELQGLTVAVEQGEGIRTLFLDGELTPHSSPLLAEETAIALADPVLAKLIMNLSELDFIDSSGLRVLIGTHQKAEEQGVEVAIHYPSPTIQRMLEITGLIDHLTVITEEPQNSEPNEL